MASKSDKKVSKNKKDSFVKTLSERLKTRSLLILRNCHDNPMTCVSPERMERMERIKALKKISLEEKKSSLGKQILY